jgi:hypothetical protein
MYNITWRIFRPIQRYQRINISLPFGIRTVRLKNGLLQDLVGVTQCAAGAVVDGGRCAALMKY